MVGVNGLKVVVINYNFEFMIINELILTVITLRLWIFASHYCLITIITISGTFLISTNFNSSWSLVVKFRFYNQICIQLTITRTSSQQSTNKLASTILILYNWSDNHLQPDECIVQFRAGMLLIFLTSLVLQRVSCKCSHVNTKLGVMTVVQDKDMVYPNCMKGVKLKDGSGKTYCFANAATRKEKHAEAITCSSATNKPGVILYFSSLS